MYCLNTPLGHGTGQRLRWPVICALVRKVSVQRADEQLCFPQIDASGVSGGLKRRPAKVDVLTLSCLSPGKACAAVEVAMWRVGKAAIWCCSGRGNTSVLCLMADSDSFNRWDILFCDLTAGPGQRCPLSFLPRLAFVFHM